MSTRGPVGITIQGARDCQIDNCDFQGFATAVDIEGGERTRVTRSRFRRNQTHVAVRGGTGHAIIDNMFEGRQPPDRNEGLEAIRKYLALKVEMPDREILVSLQAVLRERDEKGKRDAARKSSLGRWLIDHGADVNIAVNTLVTLASAVTPWFK